MKLYFTLLMSVFFLSTTLNAQYRDFEIVEQATRIIQNNYYDTYTSSILKKLHGLKKDGGFTLLNDKETSSEKVEQTKKAGSDSSKVEESFKSKDN